MYNTASILSRHQWASFCLLCDH